MWCSDKFIAQDKKNWYAFNDLFDNNIQKHLLLSIE
jgi:hypothetical protein